MKKESSPKSRTRPYRVVYEDTHVLVADKDSGVLTVPIPEKQSRNLKALLDRYLTSQKREALPVHRIDRYTSGLVVFAKNRKSWKDLVAQFRNRTPERVYLALVRGRVADGSGTLRHRLELTTDGFRQRVVPQGGTEAVTHYEVLERFEGATLLKVRLETGLKNQIRIQFRASGHPLIGDRHYASAESREVWLRRQALHAWRLAFTHPATGRAVHFEAPLPADIERLLDRLRRGLETGRPTRSPAAPSAGKDTETGRSRPAKGAAPPRKARRKSSLKARPSKNSKQLRS